MKNVLKRLCSGVVLASLTLSLTPTMDINVKATEKNTKTEYEEMTQEKIDVANNAYNNVKTNVEFITMSDTEFGGRSDDLSEIQQINYEANNWAYKRIVDWAENNDFQTQAIMINGDVVGANEAEYQDHILKGEDRLVQGWYRAVDQVLTENFGDDVYVMLANGNHDIADILGETMDENHKDDDRWYYGNKERKYVSNFHVNINGYDFITLDYNGVFHFGYTNQRNGYQQFLKDTMKKITEAEDYDSTKPIFIQAHSGYAGTSLGGAWAAEYDMMGPQLKAILKDYPQVLIGSAHTHFSSGGEFGIYQDDFTYYENQSMNYMYMDTPSNFVEGGYFDSNTGNADYTTKTCNFISVLENNTTVIRRYDVTNNRWMGMPWVVDTTAGKEGFTYTNEKRSKVAPWFEDDSKITATDVTETSLTLGFDQALDDEQVNNYEVKITDESTGNPVSISVRQLPDKSSKEGKIFTSGVFRAYSRYYYRPNIMSFEIKNLEPGKTYNVEIYAYDDFENKSEEPLVGTIETEGRISLPTIDGPITMPEDIENNKIFNMNFEKNLIDSIGNTDGISNGNISYVDSYHNAKGFAVNVEQGNNNYIDLGNREEWDLGTDKNLSVNFWIKVNAHSGYSSILSNKSWSSYTKEGINFAPRSGDTSTMELSVGDGKNGQYAFANVGDYKDAWHMMSLIINRIDQTANIYLDGKKVNSTSIASVESMTSGLNMYLGTDASKSYGNIGFYMDDLNMWSRALNDDDIKALYNVSNLTHNEKLLKEVIEFGEEVQQDIINEIAIGRVYDDELIEKLNVLLDEAKNLEESEKMLVYYIELKKIIDEINNLTVNYKVEATSDNGVITPGVAVIGKGDSITFELNPNEGYHIDEPQITVTPASGYSLDGNKLTVPNISQGTSVHVKFIKDTAIKKVSVQAYAENGTITPAVQEVEVGENLNFELIPNKGYVIEGVEIKVTPNNIFSIDNNILAINNINEDLVINVSFKKEEIKEDDIPLDKEEDKDENDKDYSEDNADVDNDATVEDKEDSSITDKPSNENSSNNGENNVQTGDSASVLVYVILLVISFVGIVIIFINKKFLYNKNN